MVKPRDQPKSEYLPTLPNLLVHFADGLVPDFKETMIQSGCDVIIIRDDILQFRLDRIEFLDKFNPVPFDFNSIKNYVHLLLN